ncbi:MAG: hypothetical protein ACI8P0_006309, partial [Planctomycetaceae bacterium]
MAKQRATRRGTNNEKSRLSDRMASRHRTSVPAIPEVAESGKIIRAS